MGIKFNKDLLLEVLLLFLCFPQWIMDALVCNGMGIYLGMKTLNYLSMKPYHWRGMWNQPTYR